MTALLSVAVAIIAGLLMTRVLKPLHLPDVTAYLITGVLKVIKSDKGFLFSNPGHLKLPVRDIYEGGHSLARNPRIQTMFRMIGLGDNIGSGFPAILNAWATENWRTVWDGGKALNNIKRSESNVANAVISRDEAINTIITTLSEQFANQDMAIAKISYLDLKEETLVSKVEQKILRQSYGNASEADVLNAKIELTTCRLERLQEKLKLAQASYLIEYLTGRSN